MRLYLRHPMMLAAILSIAHLCVGCFSVCGFSAWYDASIRPIDIENGAPLDAAGVEVQLLRRGETISEGGYASPIGGDEMVAFAVGIDFDDGMCPFYRVVDSPAPGIVDPPDEAQVTVRAGERIGFAYVRIEPEDIVIEGETYGRIDLGTVEVTFEPQP